MNRRAVYTGVLIFLCGFTFQYASTEEVKIFFKTDIYQGDPLTLYTTPPLDKSLLQAELIELSGRKVMGAPFFPIQITDEISCGASILGIPVSQKPGEYLVRVRQQGQAVFEQAVHILERPFLEEKVRLDSAMTHLRSAPDPKRDRESETLYALLMKNNPESVYHTERYSRPVPDFPVSSAFGSRRVYIYSSGQTSTTYHYGTDFAVPVGTTVRASGTGKVVFAGTRILTGNSVVLEHMPSVYSLYYHLDSLAVSTGDTIRMGDILGTSGRTGLVTGAHLHFEFRVGGTAVEPATLISAALIDKDYFISIMNTDKTLEKGR